MTLYEQMLANGFRQSDQREAICATIENSDDHPDCETIEARASGVSQATVYRTCKSLVEIGAVRGFDFFGDGRMRFEVDTHDGHGHVISQSTGVVENIAIDKYLGQARIDIGAVVELKLLIVID